jgi:predicted patatin/cPLA2 family phospholipase
MYNKLVLSGGGTKGSMYLGMLKCFEENDIILEYLNEIVGTSVGALFGMLILLGYTSEELCVLFFNTDFEKLKHPSLLNLESNYGFDDGMLMSAFIKKCISQKGYNTDVTLKDLFEITKINFVTCGYNVNLKSKMFLCKDSHPDLELCKAVRASLSIPIMFSPVNINGCLIVDGGLACNMPVSYVIDKNKDNLNDTMKKTLCVSFEETGYHGTTDIKGIEEYIYSILKSTFNAIENYDKTFLIKNGYNLLILKSGQSSTSNFTMTDETKKILYNCGYNCTSSFLKKIV